MLSGRATPEGTARYRDRFLSLRDRGHFRCADHAPGAGNLWLSSIGLGTYLGEPDEAADREYTEAIAAALRSGINVLDTAINYRHQRSERNIGVALGQLVASGEINRDEVLVCTKAGYLSFDANLPADPRAYFLREYVETGILDPRDLAGGAHCIAPAYLENQLERSHKNLGLESIDVFYLHNPESQLAEVSRPVFRERLELAFGMLERNVENGRLGYYGMATWNAFRLPEGSREYISLADVVSVAHEVGGENHHFRFIQLPFNLAMAEAYGLANQAVDKNNVSLFTAAAELGIRVVGSATLYQGRLTHGLPQQLKEELGMKTDSESAIQFARSAPGLSVALIGMSHKEHVTANLKPASASPMEPEEWRKLFQEP